MIFSIDLLIAIIWEKASVSNERTLPIFSLKKKKAKGGKKGKGIYEHYLSDCLAVVLQKAQTRTVSFAIV